MALSNENNPHTLVIPIGTQSATATVPGFKAFRRFRVVKVYFADGTGVAADNTNYAVLQLKNGSTIVASFDTRAANQGALAASVPGEALNNTTSTNLDFAVGDVAKVVFTKNGTAALAAAICQVVGYYY